MFSCKRGTLGFSTRKGLYQYNLNELERNFKSTTVIILLTWMVDLVFYFSCGNYDGTIALTYLLIILILN